MIYTIERRMPTVKQWMDLRESVGWPVFEENIAEKALKATIFCVCVFENGKLIGMGRVLGDGVISFYISNVIVRPDCQHQGIGSKIMNEIMEYVEKNAVEGAVASLFSSLGKEDFYSSFGFIKRPDESKGSGMSKAY